MKLGTDIIGLIPAAGKATRLGNIPCSKEVFPIIDSASQIRSIKPVSRYLVESMHRAGVEKVFIILRDGKWDIPSYYRDGSDCGLHIGYLIMRHPYGVPFTLDQAFPFVRNATIAFGFPDIIFQPENAFDILLERLQFSDAQVVLGLFAAKERQNWDMVDLDEDNRVTRIHVKTGLSKSTHAWVIAVWEKEFTEFVHQYVHKLLQQAENHENACIQELHLGMVINEAIVEGMMVHGNIFPGCSATDIGRPESLADLYLQRK